MSTCIDFRFAAPVADERRALFSCRNAMMNDTAELVRRGASPRKRDASATRGAILDAAEAHFARLGYDCAVLRDIARDAGVDVALVKRYFGGKEALFSEALKASFRPDGLNGWDRASFPREMATMMAGSPRGDEARTHRFQFLLRAATSPATAPLLNVAVQERFLGPIRQWLGGSAPGNAPGPRRSAAARSSA